VVLPKYLSDKEKNGTDLNGSAVQICPIFFFI
jgi:hypothetical protein